MDPLSLISPAPEVWLFPPPGSRPGPGSGESTVTEHSGGCGGKRKRKYTEATAATTKAAAAAAEDESSNLVSASSGNDLVEPVAKHLKVNGCSKTESESTSSTRNKMIEQIAEPSEPAKQDFIHVRARRGQATDSHSLAERARREKISERMRLLQDLVPGCNKVIGKASVLDEIINYVQALQSQVEFLSMKLEAVTSRMNIGMEGFSPKEFGTEAYDVSSASPFSLQPTREYGQGPATDWLHMCRLGAPLRE